MTGKFSFRSARTRTVIITFLGLCLLIGLGLLRMPEQPTPYPAYVTVSPSPSGVKGFYSLVQKNFNQVGRWEKPAQLLPVKAGGQLMIMVAPPAPLSSSEMEQWVKWMRAGNRLWLLGSNPRGMFGLQTDLPANPAGKAQGVKAGTAQRQKPKDGSIQGADLPPGTIEGAEEWPGKYQGSVDSPERLVPRAGDRVLLRDRLGVVALARAYGQGELMVLLAPDWLTNGKILQKDNLKLTLPFLTRARPQVIWFNDYVHGYNDLPAGLSVYPAWFLVFFAQLAVGLLLWLWYKGKRFGPIQTPKEWTVRYGDERISAIASWYEKGKFYQESLAIQEEYLRQTVRERWGIPGDLDSREFAEKVARRMPADKREKWLGRWRELKAASPGKISPQAYLQRSKLLDSLQKEVEKGEPNNQENVGSI